MRIKQWTIGLILVLSIGSALGSNKKIAQTGFQFLSVISDAKASSLGGAVNSRCMGSSSMYFNPATMSKMDGFVDVSASMNEWIADINHNQFSLAVNPMGGALGVFGLTYQQVDYGDLTGTRVSDNTLGYIETGAFSPTAMSMGFGYAKSITDRFSVGGQVKYVYQDLGEAVVPAGELQDTTQTIDNDLSFVAFDFGTLFYTGWKSLAFGMSVRHFSQEKKFSAESFQLPLVFTIGISMDLMDLTEGLGEMHSLVASIDATHYRSHPEQILVGLDYTFRKLLSLRGGFVTNNDEDNFSFGIGVTQFGLSVDYSYTPFGVFDNVKRITVRYSL